MADENTPGGGPAPTSAPASSPAPVEAVKIPEKFQGKSVEDVVKAYTELERKLGQNDGWNKLSDLGVGGKPANPEEIRQAVLWARQTYGRMSKGELIEAANAKIQADRQDAAPVQPSAPWEANDWDYRPEAEKAKALSEYVKAETMKQVQQIAGEYGNQFQQFRNQLGVESSVMLDAITRAIKTGKDPTQIMTLAADLKNKSPQELMDMAIKNMTAESDLDAEVEKRVAAKMAEELQKRDNEGLALDNNSPSRPARFVSKRKPSDVNKKIIEDLRKKGIRIS